MNAALLPHCVRLSGVTRDEAARLMRTYRVANPEYVKRQRMGRWLGGCPEYIYAPVLGAPDEYELPRGVAGDFGLRETLPALSGPPKVALRPYQVPACDALLRGSGYVVAPCGSGKTQIALAAVSCLPGRALVLVHTLDLKRQWVARAESLGLGEDVDVWTVQSANNWHFTEAAKRVSAYAAVILDESHHVPARTFARALYSMRAPWRWGLTATPERADGLQDMIRWYIGPELHRIAQAEVLAAGCSVVPSVRMVRWPYEGEVPQRNGELDWAGLVTGLSLDAARNAEVVRLALESANEGCSVLVLTSRVEHVEALEALMPGSVALHSGKAKRLRSEGLDALRDGRARIGIATQLADEGLDLPRLDVLILALPSRSHSKTIQRVGRIMRPSPGKGEPTVYDLVDQCAPCWGQWHARKRAYREAGVRL